MAVLPEILILKAKAAQQHPDNWPEFNLIDVEIFSPATPQKSENLLHVGIHNQVTIRGTLEELDDKDKKRLHSTWSPSSVPRLEIVEVKEYAYGAYPDGTFDIWAAGRAGWFKLTPGKKYAGMYEEMLEAVRLLYFIVDSSLGPRKRKLDQLLRAWALSEKLSGGTEEARRVLKKHRIFLIASILGRKEGLDPGDNVVFTFFQKTHAKDIATVQRLLASAEGLSQNPTPDEDVPANSQGDRKRKRDSATPVYVESKRARRTTRGRTSEPAMIDTMTRSRSRSVIHTTTSATAEHGPELVSDSSQMSRHIQRESTRQLADRSESAIEIDQTEIDQIDDNDGSETDKPAHKGKSSLRPKASKYVPPRSLPHTQDTEGTTTPLTRQPSSSRQRVVAEASSLNGSTGLTANADEDAQSETKRIRRQSGRQTAPQVPATFASPFDVVDEGIDMSLDNAEQYELNRARPIEATTAAGDVWTCPLDGCMHSVYGASTPESQKLIKAHYRLHVGDEDRESRLQLVRRMQGPRAPVSRLVSRIQSLSGFPARIARGF